MDFEENLFIAGLSAVKEKYGEAIKNHFNVEVVVIDATGLVWSDALAV